MHEVEKEDDPFAMYEHDATNVRTVHFNTNVKYTHNVNIAFDEVSSDRKLQCLLADVTVNNKIENKTTVCVKLHTGASGNLLPYNVFREIFPHVSVKELHCSIDNNVCLEAYNKSSIKQLGTCWLTVQHGKQLCLCHFFVVPDYCHPILGLNDIHALNLISIHCHVTDKWSTGNLSPMSSFSSQDDESSFSVFDAIEEKPGSMLTKDAITNGHFSNIFSGIGRFPIEPVSIVLSDDAELVHKPARRVPVALKDKFKQELKSMEKAGITSKLDHNTLTPWLNSYVIVKKTNGRLRICLDPTDLNKYIVRPVCNSHTLDDVSHLLKDAKHFSVFDATKGFFHLPIDALSRLLTVMLTPEGVYVFNVLAMGLCNAGDLFESALCDLLSGLPGVSNITDDILIYGSTQEEHDANVIHFLECCLEIDLHLNPDKVKINCKSVPFFGMILTESGIKPDPKKVEAIHNWPTPTNVSELLSFLGSVNYLS